MNEAFTLDTNVLFYALDSSAGARNALSNQVIRAAASKRCVLTVQALGELYRGATRKLLIPAADIERHVRDLVQVFPTAETTTQCLHQALPAATTGKFSFWDAIILSSATEAGCTVCLSEDMKDGAKLGRITVRHPFEGDKLSKAVQALLAT